MADLTPVRLGTRDLAAKISSIKVYRDIYYTKSARNLVSDVDRIGFVALDTPQRTGELSKPAFGR